MGGCWGELSSMKEMLKEHGFKYITDTVASSNKVINGGTAIGTSSFWDHKKSFLTVLAAVCSTSFCSIRTASREVKLTFILCFGSNRKFYYYFRGIIWPIQNRQRGNLPEKLVWNTFKCLFFTPFRFEYRSLSDSTAIWSKRAN